MNKAITDVVQAVLADDRRASDLVEEWRQARRDEIREFARDELEKLQRWDWVEGQFTKDKSGEYVSFEDAWFLIDKIAEKAVP